MDLRQRLTGAAAIAIFGCGCGALGGGYPSGSLYQGTKTPHGVDRLEMAGSAKSGDKEGESCATGILGAIAWGDASVDAAKKAGQITDVHSVELRSFSILGVVYSTGCTVVHGK
ncbi:MAG: hypothetical protein IPK82_12695 [Polyangiaceae bacterium]|nr:hypothetical protein [Polyangiaceae bacterium]